MRKGVRLSELEVARRRPTMRDVAVLAGVALKTVSRVFNDVPTVDPLLVARTRRAADQLGYRPNLAASSLRRANGRTDLIGIVAPDIGDERFASIHRAVASVARAHGSLTLIAESDADAELELELVNNMIDRRVDGLVILPVRPNYEFLMQQSRRGVAVVSIDKAPEHFPGPSVMSRDFEDTRRAVQMLLDDGHVRIAYLGAKGQGVLQTVNARYAGYAAALQAVGLATEQDLAITDIRNAEEAAQAALRLVMMGNPPTAMVSGAAFTTEGVGWALASMRKRLKMSVAGFVRAQGMPNSLVQYKLTENITGMGRLAGELLFKEVDGEFVGSALQFVPVLVS